MCECHPQLVSVLENYGQLLAGHMYQSIKEGRDYYILKCRGTNTYVPKNLIDFDPKTHTKTPEEIEGELIEEDFANFLDDYCRDGV